MTKQERLMLKVEEGIAKEKATNIIHYVISEGIFNDHGVRVQFHTTLSDAMAWAHMELQDDISYYGGDPESSYNFWKFHCDRLTDKDVRWCLRFHYNDGTRQFVPLLTSMETDEMVESASAYLARHLFEGHYFAPPEGTTFSDETIAKHTHKM